MIQRLALSGVLANTPAIRGHFEGSPNPSKGRPRCANGLRDRRHNVTCDASPIDEQ